MIQWKAEAYTTLKLAEAIASAVKLQDEGGRVLIVDSQGSGVIMVGHFDLLEAEGYLGCDLVSEHMGSDVPVAEVMISAKRTAPQKTDLPLGHRQF